MKFCFGVDKLLTSNDRINQLRHCNVGLVANPASITSANVHSLDALIQAQCNIRRAFGPQHGMRGDKQDNMIESQDYLDPGHQIPVISLYGEHRRPTQEMLAGLDIILFDLQDIGCRIYTYITTLKYFVEACADSGCELWVLDRPNPAGRPIDGLFLAPGEESFVGCAELPTRHGLTIGELAAWFNSTLPEPANLEIIEMSGYDPDSSPGYGWPANTRPWINPSPNAASLNMARIFPGTVLLEGTLLSEGRGTTMPLEVIGAPDFPAEDLIRQLALCAPEWLEGVYIRPCYFEPTFHKHVGQLCAGLQFHTDYAGYGHTTFKPYRLIAGLLKCLKELRPDQAMWRHHDYEYEAGRIPIDVINGGPGLRQWIENEAAGFDEFADRLNQADKHWHDQRMPFLMY